MTYKILFRNIVLVSLLILFIEPAVGQRWKLRRYEVGFGLGMTQVFGDIGGTADVENLWGLKDIKLDETKMAFPLYVRYRLAPTYSLKVNTIVGFGHGDDVESRNVRGRSYNVMLNELSAQFEYYFLSEEKKYKSAAMFNRRGMINNYMSVAAYGFAGLGGVYSILLDHDKGTEAPDRDVWKKSSIGAIMPVGIGLKYILSDRWLINAELGYRISFADYIEGYEQTFASKHKDVYYFLSLSVGYRLETTRRGIPTFLDRDYRTARPRYKRPPGLKNKPKNKKKALK